MALEIPANVHQAMRDANKAWDKLALLSGANHGAWSTQQQEQLAQLAQVIKSLQHALNRLINANL